LPRSRQGNLRLSIEAFRKPTTTRIRAAAFGASVLGFSFSAAPARAVEPETVYSPSVEHLGYHLTWLRRVSGDIPGNALRVQLEYEF